METKEGQETMPSLSRWTMMWTRKVWQTGTMPDERTTDTMSGRTHFLSALARFQPDKGRSYGLNVTRYIRLALFASRRFRPRSETSHRVASATASPETPEDKSNITS